jgi:hypothetical protein
MLMAAAQSGESEGVGKTSINIEDRIVLYCFQCQGDRLRCEWISHGSKREVAFIYMTFQRARVEDDLGIVR